MWVLVVFMVTLPSPILHTVETPFTTEKLCIQAGEQVKKMILTHYEENRVRVEVTCTKVAM